MSSKLPRLLLVLLVVGAYFVGVEPAHAETIRVPWPIWLLIEGWYLLVWGVAELWALLVASFNVFWAFILFITVAPLNRLMLGIVVTLGGAFLPDDIFSGAKTEGGKKGKTVGKAPQATVGTIEVSPHKLSMKGAPRYAVCLIGIMIVASTLWQFSAK
jgi:hypothetical protein